MVELALLFAIAFCAPQEREDLFASRAPDAVCEAGKGTVEVWFEMESDALRAHGRLVNRSDGPLWWRGMGIGCQSFGTVVPPTMVGEEPQLHLGSMGVGCTMEDSVATSKHQLDNWRIDPGESRYFEFPVVHQGNGEHDGGWLMRRSVDLKRLEQVAIYEEFCLPRDTPPERTLAFEQDLVLLAWHRDGRRIAFLVDEEPIHLPHYNPFAERPRYREPTELPCAYGPLRGRVNLVEVDGGVELQWEWTNASGERVAFLPLRRPDEIWEVQFGGREPVTRWDLEECFVDPPVVYSGQQNASQLGQEWWQPGETRRGSLRIPGVSLTEGERWHARFPCDLPRSASGGRVPTLFHAFWDPELGASVGFDDPFADYSRRRGWMPYGWEVSESSYTAVFDYHGMDAVGVATRSFSEVDLRFLVKGKEKVWVQDELKYWQGATPIWIQYPGHERAPGTPHLSELPPAASPPSWASHDEIDPLKPGDIFEGITMYEFYWDLDDDDRERWMSSRQPQRWELILPLPIPTATQPTQPTDLQAEWWRVISDPETGPRFERVIVSK